MQNLFEIHIGSSYKLNKYSSDFINSRRCSHHENQNSVKV